MGSLEAAADGRAELGAATGAGNDGLEAATAMDDGGDDGEEAEDEEGYDSDIELTAAGLRYATTRWDGSRNMTPNRRPTREEREGYIDNEELQDEVRRHALAVPAWSPSVPRALRWPSQSVCGTTAAW